MPGRHRGPGGHLGQPQRSIGPVRGGVRPPDRPLRPRAGVAQPALPGRRRPDDGGDRGADPARRAGRAPGAAGARRWLRSTRRPGRQGPRSRAAAPGGRRQHPRRRPAHRRDRRLPERGQVDALQPPRRTARRRGRRRRRGSPATGARPAPSGTAAPSSSSTPAASTRPTPATWASRSPRRRCAGSRTPTWCCSWSTCRPRPTAGDLEVADRLRRAGRPIMLVANKCDDWTPGGRGPEPALASGSARSTRCRRSTAAGIGDLLDALVERAARGAPVADAEREQVPADLHHRPPERRQELDPERHPRRGPGGGARRSRAPPAIPIDTLVEVDGRPVVLIDTAGLRKRGPDARGRGALQPDPGAPGGRAQRRGAGRGRRHRGAHRGRPRRRSTGPPTPTAPRSW